MKKPIKIILALVIILALSLFGIHYYYLNTPMLKESETQYLYIDRDDNIDSVYTKLSEFSTPHSMKGFKVLAEWKDFASNIKHGRYEVRNNMGAHHSMFPYLRLGH